MLLERDGIEVARDRIALDLRVLKGNFLDGLNFQPAQLAVVAGIMVLALFLSQFREMHPMLRLLLCGAIAGAPCLLILMQPDLGEVIIWAPVLLALLFVGGVPLRYLICVILIGIAFVPIAINFGLKPFDRHVLCGSGRCGAVIHAFCARGVFTGWVETELGSRHAAWHGAKATHPTSVEAATVHASRSTRRRG